MKKQQQNELGTVLRSTVQANNSNIITVIKDSLKTELETQLSVQTDIVGR